MEASFFSKPLSESECRIKITSQLLSKSECRNLGHDLTQTKKMAEAQHNADKHYLLTPQIEIEIPASDWDKENSQYVNWLHSFSPVPWVHVF